MTRIVVTGAAGFIGSNIVRGLNARGLTDIIAVDDLTQGDKFKNLADLQISDYVDADTFYASFDKGEFGKVEAVFHEGACSDTMESNGKYMMANNFARSCELFEACQRQGTRLLYASSAATYGDSAVANAEPNSAVTGTQSFVEAPANERPLNVYGYSKLLFDQRIRKTLAIQNSGQLPQVVGLRYFNVYGPREQHKGRMASVAYHQFGQFGAEGQVKLFDEYGGYAPGAQMRDFVFVDDVVAVNLWFFDNPAHSGIFNLGTGRAQPFNDVALAVVNTLLELDGKPALSLDAAVQAGLVTYVPMPLALHGKYQCFTQADLTLLRKTGCDCHFSDVNAGVSTYIKWLAAQG